VTRIVIPIKVQVKGKLALGPKPDTPEFEEEQRARAERAKRLAEPEE
jgi:hypothetical protein